jgi:hypothetical protein
VLTFCAACRELKGNERAIRVDLHGLKYSRLLSARAFLNLKNFFVSEHQPGSQNSAHTRLERKYQINFSKLIRNKKD